MFRIGAKCLVRQGLDIGNTPAVFGEIVDLQMQDNYPYTTYPIWVKIMSGENKGMVRGFKYDEIMLGVDSLSPVASLVGVK